MLFTLPVAIIGYGVIGNVNSSQVKFGMTCLMASGACFGVNVNLLTF